MKKYFAAMNTASGFVSCFSDIFTPEKVDFTYVIKGGSGTGKSSLMKKAAIRAKAIGADIEYYYCSSDPSSLDGIKMFLPNNKIICILDGTLPHIYDPRFPSVTDKIFNLADYLDSKKLISERNKLIALTHKKSSLYNLAYKDFYNAGQIYLGLVTESENIINKEKLYLACERLLKNRKKISHIKNQNSLQLYNTTRILSALSCDGEINLYTFDNSENIFFIRDFWQTGILLFNYLIKAAEKLNIKYERSPFVLLPQLTEAVYFPELNLSVVSKTNLQLDNSKVKIINMERFINKKGISLSSRKSHNITNKSYKALLSSGLSKLSEVKAIHSDIEEIYKSAMDFDSMNKDADIIFKKIGI